MKRIIAYIAIGLVALIAIATVYFFYTEAKREDLLRSYKAPPGFVESIHQLKGQEARKLMEKSESLLCALGSYGRSSELVNLNESQRASVSEIELPSEDMTWYLIFLTESRVSRVYLIEMYGTFGLSLDKTVCITGQGSFQIKPEAVGGKASSTSKVIQFVEK